MSSLEMYQPIRFGADNLSVSVDLDEYMYLNSMQNRLIEMNGEIDDNMACVISRAILQINKFDEGVPPEERVPIKLFLSSYGGDVMDGFTIIDMIENSITPIYTVNLNCWYSMACLIGCTGHKRFATKNSSFLIHDGSLSVQDSSSRVRDFMKFDAELKRRNKEIVLAHTEISTRLYSKRAREEWYFFADEAKELGVVDGIIGEDISLEEIL